ncbi:DUF1549 domain-containing protein [soil metagenome]
MNSARHRTATTLGAAVGAAVLAVAGWAPSARAAGAWDGHVRQIFEDHCVKCHGGAKQKAGLDLRSEESVFKGSENGTVVEPGDPDASYLIEVLHPDADPHMPPKGDPLNAGEVEMLRVWIGSMVATADAGATPPPPPLWVPPADISPAGAIDGFLERAWARDGIAPAEVADDRAFVRRIYLDLVGRIPATAEASAFVRDENPGKRAALAGALVATGESARHFAEVFNVVLLGRESGRDKKREDREKHRWLAYLERVFLENRPWDRVVEELILARPGGDAVERGASWFQLEHRGDHEELARTVGPAVFGRDVACAQCHDHPVAPEIKQAHYWGLVAFFTRSYRVEGPDGPAVAESASGGYERYSNIQGESFDMELAFLSGQTVAEPEKVTEESLDRYLVAPPDDLLAPDEGKEGGKKRKRNPKVEQVPVPKFSRRQALVEVALRGDTAFAEAIVNRLWGWMFGRGIVHPVDRIDSTHPASQPELMAWLVEDFAASGYDLRRLVVAMATSRAYQLAPVPAGDRPPDGSFACTQPKALTAEQLVRSLLVASGRQPDAGGDFEGVEIEPLREAFVERFPDVFADTYAPSPMRAMFTSNSPHFEGVFAGDEGMLVNRLATLSSDRAVAHEAVSAVLGRAADGEEADEIAGYLASRGDRRAEAVRQVCWALAAGSEFRFNH